MNPLARVLLALWLLAGIARADFHFVQIEEIIGGLNGDATAQAIQLRMRGDDPGQTIFGSLWLADAAGVNRILLLDLSSVPVIGLGAHILLSTGAFDAAMVAGGATGFASDAHLTTAMPVNYLAAGKLTFEADGGNATTPGTVYWSVAWGGNAYTGTNFGSTFNDDDGFFGDNLGHGKPVPFALPLTLQAIAFTGSVAAMSTYNHLDYVLTPGAATVTRNDGISYAVVPEPTTAVLLLAASVLVFARRPHRRAQ